MKPLIGGFKERTIDAGIRCRVYRNLNNKCFSVIAMEGIHRNKVVAHVDELIVEPMDSHPANVVLAGGLRRARKEARRNVHATFKVECFYQNPNQNWILKLPTIHSSMTTSKTNLQIKPLSNGTNTFTSMMVKLG